MAEMLDELKEQFEVIIIDTPALTKADAISLLPTVDGYIYVADAYKTPEDKALQSLESIKKVGGAILGAVLNNKVKDSDKLFIFSERLCK
jgi:polysaccharide biosynthesis transport protein